MGVHKDNHSCVSGVHNCPFSVNVNLFGRFAVASPSVKADVEVAKGLCVFVFRLEGIIACKDLIKVNIAVEEDIVPL